MRFRYRRLHNGRSLHEEMRSRRYTQAGLAEATRQVDPQGRGVSIHVIKMVTQQGETAREYVSARSARLLAKALDVPEEALFVLETVHTSKDSTVCRACGHSA